MKVGPLPPVVTVSCKVSSPSEATEKDWRFPMGEISFTALNSKFQVYEISILGTVKKTRRKRGKYMR